MEAQRPNRTTSDIPGFEPTALPAAERHDESGPPPTQADATLDGTWEPPDRSEIGQDGGAEWGDTDWADPGPEDVLADITDAIERLTHLDPAEAAAPGTAIADILSRALEEEER
ncbi:MAG: hypothetical protein ACFCVC_11720 [Acidimicrobiia bacterium]